MEGEDCGMVRISLVDFPAVLTNWQAFAAQAPVRFAIADEDKRLIRGVVMRADFPIYRADDRGEYYIIYRAETIRQMAEKYLAENRQNRVDTDHSGDDVEGVQMVQWFIKDTEKGIAPAGFEDVADGSLFAEFHIESDTIWDEIKAGTYRGFSLEGFFSFVPDTDQPNIDEIVEGLEGLFKANNFKQEDMAKIERVLELLRQKLEANPAPEQKFGRVTTDKGVLAWPGEADLKAGDPVMVLDADGNEVRPEDGDYLTEDGKTIVVADGIVAEIRDPEAEVAPQGEPEAEPEQEAEAEPETPAAEPEAEPDYKALYEQALERIAELEAALAEATGQTENALAENATMGAEVEALREQIAELKAQPAARPAHEELREAATIGKTGVKGLDRVAELMGK